MPLRLSALAAIAAILLAGCGQRGALELPASAAGPEERRAPPVPQQVTGQWPDTVTRDGRVLGAENQPRRPTGTILPSGSFILDPLL